jgi:hypothetical protein
MIIEPKLVLSCPTLELLLETPVHEDWPCFYHFSPWLVWTLSNQGDNSLARQVFAMNTSSNHSKPKEQPHAMSLVKPDPVTFWTPLSA